jgi:hypothetical protein
MADPAAPNTLGALPDLTLLECCKRWGVNSSEAIKIRASALGVELLRESPTRTVWPAEHLPLGDELAEHLKTPGGTLANFGRAPMLAAEVATQQQGSKQIAEVSKGCAGCLVFVVLVLFVSCSAALFSRKAPEEKKKSRPHQSSTVHIDDSRQVISDEQIGRVTAKVMCGEKSQNEAVDYLNSMNVPKEKIENFHLFPDIIKGFLAEGGADCTR